MTRIMIVDDNPHARKALTAFMSQQEGMNVAAEAANGHEAIQSIQYWLPDVVLMDVQMPIMDGLEATRIIKARWPQVRVIILTIYADRLLEALATGADGFLVKGCSMEQVTGLIRTLLAAGVTAEQGCPVD